MKNILKSLIDKIINGIILRPLNLRLAYNIGSNPIDDIKILLANQDVLNIVDGGAYKGTFSLEMSNQFPVSTIYAFEPQRDSYELLLSNTTAYPRIKAINSALGLEEGDKIFYINTSPMTNSLLRTTSNALEYFKGYNDPKDEEIVTVVTLRNFMSKSNITLLDILKLDLQGYELQALKGLGDIIGDAVKVIYVEVEFLPIYEGAPVFSDIECFLREKGYYFFQFYDLIRSPKNGRLLYGDAVFLNSKYILQ